VLTIWYICFIRNIVGAHYAMLVLLLLYFVPPSSAWCVYPILFVKVIDYLLFYIPLKNFSLIWRYHHCLWRAAKFTPMLSARGLRAGGIFIVPHLLWHGASSCFFGLIQSIAPFICLLRHTRGCWRPILIRILAGRHSVAFYNTQDWCWGPFLMWIPAGIFIELKLTKSRCKI
jgi:hypothetical protein